MYECIGVFRNPVFVFTARHLRIRNGSKYQPNEIYVDIILNRKYYRPYGNTRVRAIYIYQVKNMVRVVVLIVTRDRVSLMAFKRVESCVNTFGGIVFAIFRSKQSFYVHTQNVTYLDVNIA